MVHNGVIWNDDIVAKAQAKEGIYYVSLQKDNRFNDSEVLMYDLADVIEGRKKKLSVEGSIAFVMVQLDKNGKRKALFFGRNYGSPLHIMKYPNGFSLTSEGEGVMIDANKLFMFDYETNKFSETYLDIPSGYTSYSKGYSGYNDYDSQYEYGEYRGYDKGFNWGHQGQSVGYNSKGEHIDVNGYVVPSTSKANVFTEQVLERHKGMAKYGTDSENAEAMAIKEVKDALLYDMNQSVEVAIEFGGYMIDELRVRYDELEELITLDNDGDGKVLDEYLELDVQLELLTKAIDELANNQMQLALTDGLKKLAV